MGTSLKTNSEPCAVLPQPNHKTSDTSKKPRHHEVIYMNAVVLSYVHVAAIYGLYLCFGSAAIKTMLINVVFHVAAVLGITAGAHRLWSHKSFKAKKPLQIIIMLFSCVAAQFTIYNWVKDHRMHHKYSDTNADPHNINRGFFYSHIGWLMVKKHQAYKDRENTISLSDIKSNPVLMFQKRFSVPLFTVMCFAIPTLIPMYFWGESFINSWHITLLRYCYDMHIAFCINSFGHSVGYRPYNRHIAPAQHIVMSFITLGEGNHNFHHAFPYDYRSDEWGNGKINLTTLFIELFIKIGWAYDMKSVSLKAVKARAQLTGDGSCGLLDPANTFIGDAIIKNSIS